MKSVYQVKNDDCFRACVASILEMKLDEVPDFMNGVYEEWSSVWVERFSQFCAKKGLNFVIIDNQGKNSFGLTPDTYYIATVRMQNGSLISGWHAVIMQNGEMVHNPNRTYRDMHLTVYLIKDFILLWKS